MRKVAPDLTDTFRTGDFAKFLQDDPNHLLPFIRETLDSVGLYEQTPLETDADPYHREEWGTANRGALGRAERMVDALIDSAKALAELINRYKLNEIDAAIARLENKKLETKEARKAALQESVRLNAIRKQLAREVRHSFHQFTVKEEEPNS
ncbi:MAG: hypothetical protein U1E81_12415 [Xanthobacteraceae bacterium]